MEKIKVEIVNILNILENKEKDEINKRKYTLLKKIYQKINMNEKLVIKLNKELTEYSECFYKLSLFNKTNFKELYDSLEKKEQNEITDSLMNLKEITLKKIMGQEETEHICEDDCEHNLFDPNQLMNSKKMQKILNNKKLRYNLEQQLRKTTGMKKSSLEEILKSNIPKEQKKMFDTILNNETVKKITDKVLNQENLLKINDVFLNLMKKEEVKKELDKIKCIIDEENFLESITSIYTEFQKTQDLKDIEKLVKENTQLQEVLKKLDTAFKNDVLNIEHLKKMVMTLVTEFVTEVQKLDIIDASDIKNIKNLGGQFNLLSGFFGETKKTIEDEETRNKRKNKRREKARKEYRRKLRNKYKNKNKKTKGGSV